MIDKFVVTIIDSNDKVMEVNLYYCAQLIQSNHGSTNNEPKKQNWYLKWKMEYYILCIFIYKNISYLVKRLVIDTYVDINMKISNI